MSHAEFTWCFLVLVLLNIFINNQNDRIENKVIKFSHNTLFRATKITLENSIKFIMEEMSRDGRQNKYVVATTG